MPAMMLSTAARQLTGWRKVALIGALVAGLIVLDEGTMRNGGCERRDIGVHATTR